MSISERSNSHLEAARKFQLDLLDTFPKRPDAILQLIEALASAEKPTSVVELCQEGPFQRTYSNVHKAIDALSESAVITGCQVSDKPIDDESMSDQNLDPERTVDPSLFMQQTRLWTELFVRQLPNESGQAENRKGEQKVSVYRLANDTNLLKKGKRSS